jgi:hypothetical protein
MTEIKFIKSIFETVFLTLKKWKKGVKKKGTTIRMGEPSHLN